MTILTNIFSREKTLFYFAMWNDSDRLGYRNFLHYEVQNNLFIIPALGEKGSVWYSNDDLEKIDSLLKGKVNDFEFQTGIIKTLEEKWVEISDYLEGGKTIKDGNELLSYYQSLIEWWSAMNTVFTVPDIDAVSHDFKDKILNFRSHSEKYTEKMNKVFVEFWENKMPEHKLITSFLLPEEAAMIDLGKISKEALDSIYARAEGCFILNREIHLFKDIDSILNNKGLVLESVQAEDVTKIKGRIAQSGKVRGIVRIVKLKSEGNKVLEGDILVTEMTNPDYVPFMKIAGAIVTDEGGTTCHAAIVARELKKSCIIGTKIATKVLKDGDLVEVDAEKGVVKIIKRA